MPAPSDDDAASSTLLGRLAAALVRWRFVLLPVALVVTALAWWQARSLTFDRSIESLYAEDNPYLRDYRESKRLFGGDEFVIVAYTDPELLDAEGKELSAAARARLERLTDRLNAVPGVNPASTQDLASISTPMKVEFDTTGLPTWVAFGIKQVFNAYRLPGPTLHRLVRGMLIGTDNQTTAVTLRLRPESDTPVPRSETIAQVRQIAADFGRANGLELYVVGEPVQVLEMFRYVEEDGRTLFAVSLVLLGLVLFALLRSLRWVLLPLLVVVVTLQWTQALLVLSGLRLSMVSSMLNSLVTIIGVATAMHLAVHFRDLRASEPGRPAADSLREILIRLLPPITWTCLTTAAGFAALLSSDITPVKSFGTMMTLATVLVLIAVAVTVPGGVLLGRGGDPRTVSARSRVSAWLERATGWTLRHGLSVMLGFVLLAVVCGLGFLRLEVETDFTKNFRADSPIVQAIEFAEGEGRLGGAGTWEVNFPAPPELSEEYLDHVRNLADRLRTQYGRPDDPDRPQDDEGSEAAGGTGELTKVLAVTDGLAAVPRVKYVSDTMPKRVALLAQVQPEFIPSLYNPQAGRMRVVLRSREREQAGAKLDLIRRVEATAQKWADERLADDFPDPEVRATGLYVLLAHLIQSLLGDQVVSFLWASAGVGLMLLLAFRSLRLALIALVPNLFPIVLVIGSMGWLGVPVNIATAMIASVSMGLTVDSSVHYISGYRHARAAGLPKTEALRQTHGSVGRALVYANLALVAGFSVLTLSHFIPLVYFGILVSVAMLGGLAGNLMLLPVLIGWTDRADDDVMMGDVMM